VVLRVVRAIQHLLVSVGGWWAVLCCSEVAVSSGGRRGRMRALPGLMIAPPRCTPLIVTCVCTTGLAVTTTGYVGASRSASRLGTAGRCHGCTWP
jgi:hypothetical protein